MSTDDIFIPFSNEIDDLPDPQEFHRRRYLQVPDEIQVELDRTRAMREGEFRSWLIKNKPKHSLMTPIETNTAGGVPDIFCCMNGFSSWIECKVTISGPGRVRGTQYAYLKKLLAAGGHAKIVIQGLATSTYKPATISIYDARQIVSLPIGMFKEQGQELIFPPDLKPWYKWSYKEKKDNIDDLYLRLLLDTNEFED